MSRGPRLLPRECRDGCGVEVLVVRRMPSGRKYLALDARPLDEGSPHWGRAWVLIGEQAWRHVDAVEHFHVSRELPEERARRVTDEYPHHLHHHHHGEGDTPDGHH